jgi:hypothetical protein
MLSRQAQRLGLATQNGNPVGVLSAPMTTLLALRIRQQLHAPSCNWVKGLYSALIHRQSPNRPFGLSEGWIQRHIIEAMGPSDLPASVCPHTDANLCAYLRAPPEKAGPFPGPEYKNAPAE